MKICPKCNGDQFVKTTPSTFVLTCGDCGHVMTVQRTPCTHEDQVRHDRRPGEDGPRVFCSNCDLELTGQANHWNSITVKLPALFAQDHIARDLPHGEVLSENKRYVTVRIDEQAVIDEWLADADYYSNPYQFSEDWETRHSMARSAKRCIEIIKEATA